MFYPWEETLSDKDIIDLMYQKVSVINENGRVEAPTHTSPVVGRSSSDFLVPTYKSAQQPGSRT